MAFNIVLQVNNSNFNALDKNLSTIVTLSGTLKETTTISDPVIIIEATPAQIADCNYMTISTFNRSYFVKNIKSVRNGLWEITGHVDVLSSFKSQIRANTGIVHKSEKNYNLYLDDGSFKQYNYPIIKTKTFNTGFRKLEFVLAVAGK